MTMKTLLSALTLHQYNFRLLHWNVQCIDFDHPHEIMEGYVNKLHGYIDEVAEIAIAMGEEPLNFIDTIKHLKETGMRFTMLTTGTRYSMQDCMEKADTLLSELLSVYRAVDEHCDIPVAFTHTLYKQEKWLRLECEYKGKRRLGK